MYKPNSSGSLHVRRTNYRMCILLGISVFYGTLLKIKAGKMFDSCAEHIANESHAVIKTKSGHFSLVRLLSKDRNKIKPLNYVST